LAHEKRFDTDPLNIDVRGHNRNTKVAPNIALYSIRPELFTHINNPDGLIYNHPEKQLFEN